MATISRLAACAALLLCATVAFAEIEGDGKTISHITFRGNRKAEDDAIRMVMLLQPGEKFSLQQLREDVRSIWKMGYFEDIEVEVDDESANEIGFVVIVKEKPTIRKIFVSGAKEVGLDKINEVIDLKKEQILDPAKIKRNQEKIHDLYVEKGYYLAEVSYEIKRKDAAHIDVYFIVDEHAKVEVRQVRFLGNDHIKDGELKKVMGTQEGGWLSFITSTGTYREDAFDRDLLLITAYYYDKGFINVKIGKPEIELSADKRYLYITIPIEEGQPYYIGKIDFKGDLLESKDKYYKAMTVHEKEMFNRSKLGTDIQRLNDKYKDLGYAYVNVQPLTQITPSTDPTKKDYGGTIDITFDIQKGQPVFFGRIEVRGNTKTRDKVIRRELRIYEGELYNQSRLDRSKRLIQALGYFEKVEISTKAPEGSQDRIDVTVEVAERATGTFQIGAGFSSVENFIGQAQVAQNNLFGRGTTLQLSAQISSLRQLFSLRYLDPYFLDTRLTFAFSGYNSLLYYPSFNRTARGGDITFGYLFGDYLRLFATYKLEQVEVKQNQAGLVVGGFAAALQVAPGTIQNLFRAGWTSLLRLSLNYDTRDDRMFPKRGMFLSASIEAADPLIASQAVFVRGSAFTRFYRPIWKNIIFRTNIETGIVWSRSELGVPIYERYLIGGINTIRGFRLFTLGPKVKTLQGVDPSAFLSQYSIGGNWQLLLNMEVEFPIFQAVNIRGVIFFDAGNAYNLESVFCPSPNSVSDIPDVFNPCNRYPTFTNLRYSVGFGFRWFSPIGPLRFEWGVPLKRERGEDNIVFEFTIGNFF